MVRKAALSVSSSRERATVHQVQTDAPSQATAPVVTVDEAIRIFEECRPALHRLCVSLLRNEWDAQDAVQEALARTVERLDTVHGSVHAYLMTIARNICYRELSRRARHADNVDEELVFDGPETDQVATDRFVIRRVWERLSPRYRALLAYWFAGYSYDEIAVRTGLSVSAVTSKLWRARQRARELGETAASAMLVPVGLWRRGRRALTHAGRVNGALPSAMSSLQHFATVAAALFTSIAGGVIGGIPGSSAASLTGQVTAVQLSRADGGAASPQAADRGIQAVATAPSVSSDGRPRPTPTASPQASPGSVDPVGHVLTPGDGAQPGDARLTDLTPAPGAGGVGFASGTLVNECQRSTGCPVIFSTADGGHTWQRVASSTYQGGPILLPPSYPSDPTLFAMGGAGLQQKGAQDSDFRLVLPVSGPAAVDPTSAPGDTRVLVAAAQPVVYSAGTGRITPGPSLPAGLGQPDSATFLGHSGMVLLAAQSVDSVVPSSAQAVVVRCAVAGACVSVFQVPGTRLSLAVSPAFDSDHTVVAYSSSHVYVSHDGGVSFGDATPALSGSIRDVALGSGADCTSTCLVVATTWVAGTEQGQLLLSDDGGATYGVVDAATPIRSVTFLGDDRLLAGRDTPDAGGQWGVRCSADDGESWGSTC